MPLSKQQMIVAQVFSRARMDIAAKRPGDPFGKGQQEAELRLLRTVSDQVSLQLLLDDPTFDSRWFQQVVGFVAPAKPQPRKEPQS